jgi:hypothetical protein
MKSLFEVSGRGAWTFRLLVGLVVVYDLGCRFRHARELFVDDGLIPRSLRNREIEDMNLHMMCGSWLCVSLVFLLHAAAAVRFMLPGAGQWDTFFLWFMQRSMVLRSIECSGGGEVFITRILFFAMLAPLGPRGGSGVTVAVLRLQICAMYWGSVGHKVISSGGHNWVGDLSATARALSIESYALEPAVWLRDALSFDMTCALTALTLATETLGPLLMISPWGPARATAVAGMAAMHLAFGTCLNIGTFHLFNTAALSLFWPFAKSRAEKEAPEPAEQHRSPLRFLLAAASVVFFLAFPVAQNIEFVRLGGPDARAASPLKSALAPLGRAVPLDQRWHMFMGPPTVDRYIALPGRLFNSSLVRDVRSGTAGLLDQPDHLQYARNVEAVAWARSSNLLAKTWTALIHRTEVNPDSAQAMTMTNALGSFYCRQFNDQSSHEPAPSSLAWFDIASVSSPIPGPEGRPPRPAPPRVNKIGRHFCYLDPETKAVLTIDEWTKKRTNKRTNNGTSSDQKEVQQEVGVKDL